MPSTITQRLSGTSTSIAVKAPVRAATTANITLSGAQTIDGVALVADDRVLVKNQTTTSQNGIYVVSATTWARAKDFDGAFDAVVGTLVFVTNGTINADTFWRVSAVGTIGIDAITWVSSNTQLAGVSSFMQTVLDDTTAGAARATLDAQEDVITTKGDLLVGGSSGAASRLAVGTDGFVLKADSAQASGLAWAILAAVTVPLAFECQLTKSGSNLLLSRYNGKYIFINGALETIPSSGPTLGTGGAASSTFYYIYVYMSAGTMTLEFSATVPTADSTYGHQIKTADATRSLVGCARTTSGTAWADTTEQRFVLSYYNRREIAIEGTTGFSGTTASATFAEINTLFRVEFITWANESVHMGLAGGGVSVSTTANVEAAVAFDGTTPEANATSYLQIGANTTGYYSPMGYTLHKSGLAVGYHYATLVGKTSAGTVTFGSTGKITGMVRG